MRPDTATPAKPSNPISKTADAVKSTVDGVRKAVTDVGSSLQGAAQERDSDRRRRRRQLLTSLIPNGPKSIFNPQTNCHRRSAVVPAPSPAFVVHPRRPTPASNDNATGSVTIPIVDVTLPYLPDAPRFAFPTPGAGLPPSFGSQGTNNRFPLGPAAAPTNGNNLFGLNFFDIGNNNLLTANNVGTGLQGIIAGNGNTLAGNQVITPTSFGTNFGWMGNNNGSLSLLQNPADLLNLTPAQAAVSGIWQQHCRQPVQLRQQHLHHGQRQPGHGQQHHVGRGQLR